MKKRGCSLLAAGLIALWCVGPVWAASGDTAKKEGSKPQKVEWGASSEAKGKSSAKPSLSDKVGKQAQQMKEKTRTTTGSSSDRRTSSGLGSTAKSGRGAAGGASGSAGGQREKVGASTSQKAGREMDRRRYTEKLRDSDQKIQALQKRIQESRKREKDLNAEHQKTNQAIIRDSAIGAVGEEAGSRGSRTQRAHERGKAALDGPGVAMTQARDTWSKNVDAERQTRQGLERDLKAAQSEKESYQRRLKDLR